MTMLTVGDSSIYHEVHGDGAPVVLLHGGFCSIEMMRPQLEGLSSGFEVFAPERPGHGRSPDVDGPISYQQGLAGTLAFLDAVGVDSVHVVGFSDGAIIGLMMAIEHPERVRSLVAISANLDPSGFDENPRPVEDASERAEGEIDRTRQLYNELSPDGPAHADVVVAKLMQLWTTEPHLDPLALSAISAPTLVMAGDRDVIAADHTKLIFDSLQRGRLCIVPGASHGLLDEKPDLVTAVIRDFLESIA